MTKSYVLMTALPPTQGHLDLIKFATQLTEEVHVIVNTQPDEPFYDERVNALHFAVNKLGSTIYIRHIHQELPQEPEDAPGFWDMWAKFLIDRQFQPGDYIVASEMYGKKLAEVVRGVFMPYDLQRQVRYTKATEVRKDWYGQWDQMIPEFRFYLQKKVTIFGVESTGKTTLTNELGYHFRDSTTLPEWARPYLEAVGPELTVSKMDAIHRGQMALQRSTYRNAVSPLVIQDTDLFSTLGYWRNWDEWSLPQGLKYDAMRTASDLYIVTKSNIPFEADPLRYGGDKRELNDHYWIKLLQEFELPFVVLEESDLKGRLTAAMDIINNTLLYEEPLNYQRRGEEYEAQA